MMSQSTAEIDRLLVEAAEARTDRVLAAARRHDCADRRSNNMAHVLDALDGIAGDADAIAAGLLPWPLAYDLARRARSLRTELENFRARDLINMRAAQS